MPELRVSGVEVDVGSPAKAFEERRPRQMPTDVHQQGTGAGQLLQLGQGKPVDLLAVFETGSRYQMYHALALFVVTIAATRWPLSTVRAAGWLFIAGTLLFSGSLYALALTGVRSLGAITPVGGLCFLAGWLALAYAAVKNGVTQ